MTRIDKNNPGKQDGRYDPFSDKNLPAFYQSVLSYELKQKDFEFIEQEWTYRKIFIIREQLGGIIIAEGHTDPMAEYFKKFNNGRGRNLN
jgi:hypothetical protein